MISRRNILLGLGAVLAAPAVVRAPSLMQVRGIVMPEPVYETGQAVAYPLRRYQEETIAFVRMLAEKQLPPGSRYEVRQSLPMDYGRTREMAWYHASTMEDRAGWGMSVQDKPRFDPDLGVIIVGRYTVPPRPIEGAAA